MRTHLAAALAASLLFSGSAATLAAQGSKAAAHATAEKTTSGMVKSIDANKLVLKTKNGEMTFSLGSTKVDNIAAGAAVQVHYKTEGKNHIATSIMPESKPTTKK
jgi:hypothetical protein